MDKINMKTVSLELSNAVEDKGVSEELLKFRRHACHLKEMLESFEFSADLSDRRMKVVFHTFGSQIEGSTTVGMNSDFDQLCYETTIMVCLNDAQKDRSYVNYLLVQNSMSFPQCCCLQSPLCLPKTADWTRMNQICPERSTEVIDRKGRAWLKSSFLFDLEMSKLKKLSPHIEQHGPAIAVEDVNIEKVTAIYCIAPPADCLVLLQRPRPGHWPKEETLTKAKQFGIFLMKPGTLAHTFDFDSKKHTGHFRVQHSHDYASVQWRMSTNLTERLLMFDLNLVQVKTYTVTKMIKKELLYPLVGDNLSSFHMKTALLFTVEQFPESVWTDDNLVQCVLYCLNTLKRFVKRRHCPHYTVAKVNLFSGKLQKHQFQSLNDKLTEIMKSKLSCILSLQMDHIGKRISAIQTGKNAKQTSRTENQSQLIKTLFFHTISGNYDQLGYCRRKAEIAQIESQIKFEYENCIEHRHELEYILQNISSTRASIAASACIKNKTPITKEIQKMYEYSICSGNITNRLKYASMLVCTKQLERAEAQLDLIEKLITADMVPYSSDRPSQKKEPEVSTKTPCAPSEIFMSYLRKLLFPVEFLREELHCLPSHLIFEMYRTITEEDKRARPIMTHWTVWFDTAKIDAQPFLYYLQYLSTDDNKKKFILFGKLLIHVFSEANISRLGHLDTTYNIMGLIEEMKNDLPRAWKNYKRSIMVAPHNNAAYWHLFRLFGQVYYDSVSK